MSGDETRIRFIVETPVILDALPSHAWGRCQRHHGVSIPHVVNGEFVMSEPSPDHWVLPVGAIVQLPTERATDYVAAGRAEIVTDSPTGLGTFHMAEPLDRQGNS